jgi:hypothetical protein
MHTPTQRTTLFDTENIFTHKSMHDMLNITQELHFQAKHADAFVTKLQDHSTATAKSVYDNICGA